MNKYFYFFALSYASLFSHADYTVLGVGEVCIDISVHVEEPFLVHHVPGEKGGSKLVTPETLNQILEASCQNPKISPGGSAANTIKGLAALGLPCGFLTQIGTIDRFGEHFVEHLKEKGIAEKISLLDGYVSTQLLCLITPDGERTMRVSSQKIPQVLPNPDHFNTKLLHIEGYYLRVSSVFEEILQLAKKSGSLVSLDLSSFETVLAHRQTILKLLPLYVDILFANEEEVRTLTGLSPEEGCLKLQEECPLIVMMQGDRGCTVGYGGKRIQVPAFPAKALNTTGAGDLFASGFLYGYLHGYPLETCARIGNRLGSAIIEVEGAELPLEKWEEIKEALRTDPSFSVALPLEEQALDQAAQSLEQIL